MAVDLKLFRLGETSPPSVTDIPLGSVKSWLIEIIRPVGFEPATGYSIEFVVLSQSHELHDHDDDGDLNCLSELLEAMGLNSTQIIVRNDTVDFNIHHIDTLDDSLRTDPNLQVYSIGDNVFGICWTWDPLACSTRGLLWYRNVEAQREASFVLKSLTRFGPVHSHALLPALSTLQTETFEMRTWVNNQAEEIMALQIRTGHHYYADAPFYAEERDSSSESQTPDLAMMSRKVSGLAVNITTSVLCLQRIVQLADFILEGAIESMKIPPKSASDSSREQRSLNSARFIVERTRSAKRQAEGLLAEAEAWKHKATIVVQTLLSLITQRDQNISIAIAQDSRTLASKATRDSTSMKAIAAVTMCFLPGTFVASLFAMPMLDWDASSERFISRYF